MKRNTAPALVTEGDDVLEGIGRLEEQLASAPMNSRRCRRLRVAIRLEANAYRQSLDAEQAAATHDERP